MSGHLMQMDMICHAMSAHVMWTRELNPFSTPFNPYCSLMWMHGDSKFHVTLAQTMLVHELVPEY